MYKLFLPSLKKLRIVYSFLLLRGVKQHGIVSYSDVSEALAFAGVSPGKYVIKRYLMMLEGHNPQLIRFYRAGLYDMYYRIIPYALTADGNLEEIGIEGISQFTNDLIRVLHDDIPDSFVTVKEVISEVMAGGQNVHDF